MATINLSEYQPLEINNADEFTIGIVFSEWNNFVTHRLRDAAIEILKKEGVRENHISIFQVLVPLNFLMPQCSSVKVKSMTQ